MARIGKYSRKTNETDIDKLIKKHAKPRQNPLGLSPVYLKD